MMNLNSQRAELLEGEQEMLGAASESIKAPDEHAIEPTLAGVVHQPVQCRATFALVLVIYYQSIHAQEVNASRTSRRLSQNRSHPQFSVSAAARRSFTAGATGHGDPMSAPYEAEKRDETQMRRA